MSKDNDIETITGVSMYAKLIRPAKSNRADIPDTWELDLLIDQKGKAVADKLGLRVRNKQGDEKMNQRYIDFVKESGLDKKGYTGEYVRFSKKTTKAVWDQARNKQKYNEDGPMFEPAQPPQIRDSAGNLIPTSDAPLLGNGSVVTVSFALTKPAMKGHGEYGGRLISVRILELVPYEAAAPTPNLGGYVHAASPADDMADDVPKFANL